MKKYSVFLAIIALVLASLACQTVMGGGNNIQLPDVPNVPDLPQTDDNGGVTVGGDSEFPTTIDAFNVASTADMLTFQTKMSTDDVLKFYRDEFSNQGYKEDTSMAITLGKTFTLAFKGHESGKVIYVVGTDAGDGSIYVTITLG